MSSVMTTTPMVRQTATATMAESRRTLIIVYWTTTCVKSG